MVKEKRNGWFVLMRKDSEKGIMRQQKVFFVNGVETKHQWVKEGEVTKMEEAITPQKKVKIGKPEKFNGASLEPLNPKRPQGRWVVKLDGKVRSANDNYEQAKAQFDKYVQKYS